ncbi:MAG: hypothetical protein Q8L48_20145 [Archangium sp.]|nr:hypothetical protein [Archangium sp.]
MLWKLTAFSVATIDAVLGVDQVRVMTRRKGYCVFVDTVFQGPIPTVSNGEGRFVVFRSVLAARREIAEHTIARLQQFLDGERDFEDATTVEEYIVAVTVERSGRISDIHGNRFGNRAAKLRSLRLTGDRPARLPQRLPRAFLGAQ